MALLSPVAYDCDELVFDSTDCCIDALKQYAKLKLAFTGTQSYLTFPTTVSRRPSHIQALAGKQDVNVGSSAEYAAG